MKNKLFFICYLLIFSLATSYSQNTSSPIPVAIIPFDHPNDLESNWLEQIELSFQNEIVEKGKEQFVIVERSRIEVLIKEQEFQASMVDEKTAVRLAEFIGVKKIILGKIVYVDNKHNRITIAVRLVDVETGQIISAPQVDSDLYLGSIRYWISKLVNEICGKSIKDDTIIIPTMPEIILPKIPEKDKGITLPVNEYKDLQDKIYQYAKNHNFVEALRYLDELSTIINNDLNNTFYKNNEADYKYLNELNYWYKDAFNEIKKLLINYEVSKAINIISGFKADYISVMRLHISPTDSQATKIRWEGVIDVITKFEYPDDIFKNPLVQQAYGNVFRIRLIDDIEELKNIRVPAEITFIPSTFSPDNDGVEDELLIKTSMNYPTIGAEWNMEIRDPMGNHFKSFSGEGTPPAKIFWNGLSDKGELVQSASDYQFKLSIVDAVGKTRTVEKTIMIDILVMRDSNILRIRIPSITFKPNTDNYIEVAKIDRDKNMWILNRLAQIFKKYREYNIIIEGHTVSIFWRDSIKSQREQAEILIPLSKSRADAIKKALVDLGIEVSRISTEGVGAASPIMPFSDEENLWKNRRMEFILIK